MSDDFEVDLGRIEAAVHEILAAIGEDVDRDGGGSSSTSIQVSKAGTSKSAPGALFSEVHQELFDEACLKAAVAEKSAKTFKEKNFENFIQDFGKVYHNETEKAESMESFESTQF